MTIERTYPEGVTCWVDTRHEHLDEAMVFYGGLLGWEFTTATPPQAPQRYVIASLDGQDVAGLGDGAPGDDPAWLTYVAVGNADAVAEQVAASGGTVLEPPADAGPGGRGAICRDPGGARFALWQANKRLGAQVTNSPGAWNFSDLHAESPAVDFYAGLFPWKFVDLGFATVIQVPGYGDHLESTVDPDIRARQAAVATPTGFEDVIGRVGAGEAGAAPHWHVTFSVADRDAAAARAEELGGAVLALDELQWARTALIRDPAGAQFTASQFTPPE